MTEPSDVTLVADAIHNPSEPRHFMQVVPAPSRQTATAGGSVIADSSAALVVKEVGRGVYDPVVYFPRADVDQTLLRSIDRTTHCPLKGDTEYFDVVVDGGGTVLGAAAWSYVETIGGADVIRSYVAFDPKQVAVAAAV